jgi:hypothetical protein
MQDKLERLIKKVYRGWKSAKPKIQTPHPDEETMACFLEGRLSPEESESLKLHLASCDSCIEAFVLQVQLQAAEEKEVPPELVERAKGLLAQEDKAAFLEIILRLKEKALELVNTTGDILLGQEFVPAPVLRSRSIKDFKDEITILKDFKDITVEVKIENKAGEAFDLFIKVKQKESQKLIKDLRVTLTRDDLELESYLTDSGSVTFEHVLLGKYKVQISTLKEKLAFILLDIKV